MAAEASEKMVDPAPTATPPISQSMDSQNSSKRFSGDAPSGLLVPDAHDRSSSSTPSPSRQLDPQTSQSPARFEEYRQLFRLPPDEVFVQNFICALQENFLLQGHIYLFDHYICFYSNLFGFETKKTIPFHEVTSVRREKAVALFPTAIEILAGGKKYFFTSFLSRDEAFKLIYDGWLLHSDSKEITDQQEPKSDIIIQENGSTIVEESGGSVLPVDESSITESGRNTPISEVCEHFVESEPSIVSTSLDMQVREEQNAGAAQNLVCPPSSKPSAWEARHVDAPGVPECYTKVAESKFPIQVEEFFDLFVSDDGINFQESFHRKCGDKDFKCTTWRPHEKYGHTRDVSFQHPIKIYFGARFGSCQEVQKYRVYRNSHLIVDTSQEINDVPYGDYFNVEGRWDVEKDSSGPTPGCILRVYTSVAFSKKTMWKGKIVQSTVEECREAYAICIDHAHEVLKQKNLEKEVGGRASDLLISNEQVRLENQANTVNYVEVRANDMRVSQIVPDMNDVNKRVTGPPQGNISKASVGSIVEDIFVKLSTSLRHQSMPSLLLIISVAIILLLMQMSILVLLDRPQRIHVIQHADSTSSMHGVAGESRSEETITLLNKQIKYLKEEMYFMETLLEKMQHEHALLKGKLKELGLFRNQRV